MNLFDSIQSVQTQLIKSDLLPFRWPRGAKHLTTQDSEIQKLPKHKKTKFFSQHITPKKLCKFAASWCFVFQLLFTCFWFIVMVLFFFWCVLQHVFFFFDFVWYCLRYLIVKTIFLVSSYTTQPTVQKPEEEHTKNMVWLVLRYFLFFNCCFLAVSSPHCWYVFIVLFCPVHFFIWFVSFHSFQFFIHCVSLKKPLPI